MTTVYLICSQADSETETQHYTGTLQAHDSRGLAWGLASLNNPRSGGGCPFCGAEITSLRYYRLGRGLPWKRGDRLGVGGKL